MTANASIVTIHMVSSLDGYIAKEDGDVSWMYSKDHYPNGITLSEEDIIEFLNRIDCYVMGSRTYEHALELGWPYGDKPVFVLSHRILKSVRNSVKFYSGNLNVLLMERLKPKYRNIWVVGGAMVTKDFIRMDLADEIIISIMPIILGGGTLFFDYIGKEQQLHLRDMRAYKDGMVELCYETIKD